MNEQCLKEWALMVACAETALNGPCPLIEDEVIVEVDHELTRVRDCSLTTLSDYIKTRYGSVYRAVKETGIADTQLRRWIKAGALIDKDGQVWIKSKGRLPVDELHTGAAGDIDTTKR